jgi:hypothetical protein
VREWENQTLASNVQGDTLNAKADLAVNLLGAKVRCHIYEQIIQVNLTTADNYE